MLALLLLLGVAGGSVGSDSSPLGTMTDLVKKVNLQLGQMGLDVLSTPYLYYDFFLGSVQFRDARLGNLSMLQILPDVEQKIEQTPDGSYAYDLTLGLHEAFLRFGFNFTLTPWVSGSGVVNLTESGLWVTVRGSYTPRSSDRSCTAKLERLQIRGLGDFSLSLAPRTLFRSLLSFLGETGLRHSSGWLQGAVNKLLVGSKDSAVVQDIYRELLCLPVTYY